MTDIFGFKESRQRGRFAGFSLYVSSTGYIPGSTLCYKDGPELPPLNFTTTCIESGRYVIFYNERLKDIIYPEGYKTLNVSTELCEFIVKGMWSKRFLCSVKWNYDIHHKKKIIFLSNKQITYEKEMKQLKLNISLIGEK